MNLPLLTASRLKTARACLRMHKLRYLDGYKSAKESHNTRFGSLMHLGLEHWWIGKRQGTETLGPALDAIASAKDADPYDVVKAEVMMIGYDARWSDDDYDVLAVEAEFSGPLVNPITGSESKIWQRGGKIDAIVRERSTGRVLVVEHKTSSEDIRQGSEYWRRLRMDGQVTAYFEGARFLGHDVAGCLYDVLAKPGAKPARATPPEARKYTLPSKKEPVPRLYAGQRSADETPQEYRARLVQIVNDDPAGFFQRGEVARLESEMHEGLLDDWHFAQGLRDSIRLGRFPRNPGACIQYGSTCQFFPACTGEASIDDTTRFTRSDNVHPELALAELVRAAPDERENKEQTA